jgi:alkylation response protein AidB-like acyl-CoA dehydrogenase
LLRRALGLALRYPEAELVTGLDKAPGREQAAGYVELMTPICKAGLTDIGLANASLAVQVYGGHGYGTLQEYLVIDKYIDEIKPDLILLQVCSNDFTNNLENEAKSSSNYL